MDGAAPCPGATGRLPRPGTGARNVGTAPARAPGGCPGRPAGQRCSSSNRAVRTRSQYALPWLRDAIGTGVARAGDSNDLGAEPVRLGLPAEVTPDPEVSSGCP